MDLVQFENELRKAIRTLDYVKSIDIKKRSQVLLQGLIELKKKYKLSIFFNEAYYVISFSLIYRKQRIWAIDRDNRVGWHIHPIGNADTHKLVSEMTISQVIKAFDDVCKKIYNK